MNEELLLLKFHVTFEGGVGNFEKKKISGIIKLILYFTFVLNHHLFYSVVELQ